MSILTGVLAAGNCFSKRANNKKKENELKGLKSKIQLCSDKLERAKKLTDLLSDENLRWHREIKLL